MQGLGSDCEERLPLYALPIEDIDSSERQPNPPAAGGERLGDSLAVAGGIGRPNLLAAGGERLGDSLAVAGGTGHSNPPAVVRERLGVSDCGRWNRDTIGANNYFEGCVDISGSNDGIFGYNTSSSASRYRRFVRDRHRRCCS